MNDLVAALGLRTARELTIVSGAGASIEHPTHAPSGVELTRSALRWWFLDRTKTDLERIYKDFASVSKQSVIGRPRLEAVLDVARQAHGEAALQVVADWLSNRDPNRVHRMLAAHLAAGGRQVSANFDRYIETAAAASGGVPIVHFHGQIGRTGDSLPFGAYLSQIERGLAPAMRAQVIDALTHRECRVVAWFGYSFSDYFDLTPAVAQAIVGGRLRGRTLLWFGRPDGAPEIRLLGAGDVSPATPEVIRLAIEHHLPVYRLTARAPGDLLFSILEGAGCHLQPAWATEAPCDRSDLPSMPDPLIESATRHAASRALLLRFGLMGRFGDPGNPIGMARADLPADSVEAYWWKKGRYRRAYRARVRATAIDDPWRTEKRLVALGQLYWIEGRLRRAGRAVLRALELLGDRDAPAGLLSEALERFGRITVHMSRYPDARRLLLPGLVSRLPDYPERCDALIASWPDSLSAEARAHLVDAVTVHRELVLHEPPAAPGVKPTGPTFEQFGESESLASQVDYTRRDANRGAWPYPIDDKIDWQVPMAKLYALVGNGADALRMKLLTSYEHRPPSPGEALLAALGLDASLWQRGRLLAKYMTALAATFQDRRRGWTARRGDRS